ncbi:MAG: ATP-dependent DNA helicase PcrA, partial [Parcubacteria group bacterium CG_4_9_14_0_2_um_filter_41_8]
MQNKQDILKGLNPEQKQAVEHQSGPVDSAGGPLLIVAGAGTGKTTVITRRIAHLMINQEVKGNEILALTFTNKAAQEMEERIDKLVPYGYTDLWVSTFHTFAQRILEQH